MNQLKVHRCTVHFYPACLPDPLSDFSEGLVPRLLLGLVSGLIPRPSNAHFPCPQLQKLQKRGNEKRAMGLGMRLINTGHCKQELNVVVY